MLQELHWDKPCATVGSKFLANDLRICNSVFASGERSTTRSQRIRGVMVDKVPNQQVRCLFRPSAGMLIQASQHPWRVLYPCNIRVMLHSLTSNGSQQSRIDSAFELVLIHIIRDIPLSRRFDGRFRPRLA
jgi:hypothetical protein